MENRILVKNVIKRFRKTTALNRISFSSSKGMNLILGPNGAGKSTLLRCIDGLYHVDSGAITVSGRDPYKDHSLKEKLSLLTDNYALYDFLSVAKNMKFFGRLYGLKDSNTMERTKDLLKELNAIEYLDTKVYALSRGTKQKVAFCRAIINEPDVLLLDEPTAFLDAHTAESVRKILFSYVKENKTVVLVTQKLDEVTRFNGSISIIKAGKIVKTTTTTGLYSSVLNGTIINIRLAKPTTLQMAQGIKGFLGANEQNPTLLKFKVKSYKDINEIIGELIKKDSYIVSIDYIEPLIENLSL